MNDVRDSAQSTAEPAAGSSRGQFIWYELLTADMTGARRFYGAVVGWTIADRSDFPNDYRMIGRSDGGFAGGAMEITDEMRSHGARPTWLAYIGVDDVDAEVARIEAAGGKALMPPFDIPDVGRVAMVIDPQGAPFYVMKPVPPASDPNAVSDVFSPTGTQRVGWNELNTSNPAAARAFYGDQFGWSTEEFMPMGEMGEYRFIDYRGTRLGALCNVMPGGEPKWRFYFRVPSISAAKPVIEAEGGAVRMGPHQVPTGDYVIIGSDPQGAEFALVGGE